MVLMTSVSNKVAHYYGVLNILDSYGSICKRWAEVWRAAATEGRRGGAQGTHLLLAVVIWPLTMHFFREGAGGGAGRG